MPLWSLFGKEPVPPATNSLDRQADLVAPIQSFGLKLLQQSAAPAQNVFISPLSIFLALSMIENGAAGETKAAIRQVLELPLDAKGEAICQSTAALLASLQFQGPTKLAIANALWVDVKSPISPDFVSLCRTIYDASAEILDLSQASAAARINDWVSAKTRGKIPSIVNAGEIADAPALLTNAIYFKGAFHSPFEKEITAPKPFRLADGREKLVPMMRQSRLSHSYRSGKRFEAAVLRYESSSIELCLLLPDKDVSPQEILTEESVQEVATAKESAVLDLSVPRFTMDFSGDLKNDLTRLGMGIAFQTPGADFSAMGSPLFFIGQILHKSRIEVNEAGTEAAAATLMVVELSALRPQAQPRRKVLIFNRPFAVLLRDTITGAIAFAGAVYDPQG